jgi:hypothetical protein
VVSATDLHGTILGFLDRTIIVMVMLLHHRHKPIDLDLRCISRHAVPAHFRNCKYSFAESIHCSLNKIIFVNVLC